MFAVEQDDKTDASRPVTPGHITGAVWRELADHVIAWFDGMTIQDLVKRAEDIGLPRVGAGQPMYFI